MTDEELEAKTIQELVALYNARAVVPTAKFRDKESAVRRVKELYSGGEEQPRVADGSDSAFEHTMPPETGGAEEIMADETKTETKGKGKPKKTEAEKAEAKAKREAGVFNCAPAKEVKPPKEGSKRDRLIKMLKNGAKLETIMKEFSWTRGNVLDALRQCQKVHGYGFETNSAGTIRVLGA